MGSDLAAQKYLDDLDNDPDIGDLVDVVSDYDVEAGQTIKKGITLTPEMYLLKMCLGPIAAGYDDFD